MMSAKLRWGFLSTARINSALFEPLKASRRNQVVAVASRTQDKADAYARKNKIKRAFGSYQALLDDPDVDIIYNSLPNHIHMEWTVKALQAGKHVLCEKPLALTVEEVDAISAAAEKYDRHAVEAFMYRTHAQTTKVKEIVADGRLGKVRVLHGSFTNNLDYPEDYRWNPQMGGGALWDVGCYPLSFMRMLLGVEPVEVYGRQVTLPSGVDATFIAQMQFPADVHAQFDCSIKLPHHTFLEIIGDEATLIVPHPFTPHLNEKLYITGKGKTTSIAVKGSELYVGEVEDMADAVLLGSSPHVTLADSRGNVRAIQALLESARTGKPVAI
jgi:D-xylose 1-dehydrogenase (NADP+, D-xylono-1,5-lactone-forming)